MNWVRNYLPPFILFVSVLLLWEFGVWAFGIQKFLLPAPSVIGEAFFENLDRLGHIGWFTAKSGLVNIFDNSTSTSNRGPQDAQGYKIGSRAPRECEEKY